MNNDSGHSLPSNATGARISPNEPTPKSTPASDGQPKQPSHAGYMTKNSDLPDSSVPALNLPSAKSISDGIARELARSDAANAAANGDTQYAERKVRDDLARAVKAGEMFNAQAQATWTAMFGDLDPSSVK